MAIDISGIFLFMPIFSFLFVFLIVFAILNKTKILGEGWTNMFVSMIMAIIFLSFSSLDLYVRTIIPWFIVLFVCTFLILLIAGLAGGKMDWIANAVFGWTIVGILVAIFLISAIYVFNPVFHPDLIIASGQGGTSLVQQLRYAGEGRWVGTLLLIGIGGLVAWIVGKS